MAHSSLRQTLQHLVQRQLTQIKPWALQFALAACVVIAGLNRGAAWAQLTLTPAAREANWRLSTFVSGFSPDSNGFGPVSTAFTDQGTVIVTEHSGNVRVFPDIDGQVVSGPPAYSYGAGNALYLVRIGKNFYMAQQNNNAVVQINPDGTPGPQVVGGLTHASCLAVNPKNKHLFVDSYDQTWIAEVNPNANPPTASSFLTLDSCVGANGMVIDGDTLYVEARTTQNQPFQFHILGFRLSDKLQVFDSGSLLGPEGIALGGSGRNASLFVNTIYGEVYQIDFETQVISLIASGGSQGVGIAVDSDGTLLITQLDRIMRLTPPDGSAFLSASIGVSPSTVAGSLVATGTITLSTPAPIDLPVSLSSSDPTLAQPVDAHGNPISSVMVQAGALTQPFSIATSAVSTVNSAFITAALNYVNSNAKLKVRPTGVKTLTLSPPSVKGGNSVTGTVTLKGAAAPGSITVTFTSSDPTVVPTPAPLTILAGRKSATFTVNTTAVTANTTVRLWATANAITSYADLVVTP